jgi:hypothetical protein
MTIGHNHFFAFGMAFLLFNGIALAQPPNQTIQQDPHEKLKQRHYEAMDDRPGDVREQFAGPAQGSSFGKYQSVQVNVNANGNNIMGDAANEPSIAMNPDNPENMVIGWRQFNTVSSNFRQAGRAFTTNGGMTWTFPGVLDPGVFRSDPVLDSDSEGRFYYYSLTQTQTGNFRCDMFISADGGVTWTSPIPAGGGDKQWFAVDKTLGIGDGNVYAAWSPFYTCCPSGFFTSSTDGFNYIMPIPLPEDIFWGTVAVGPDGELYVCGHDFNDTPYVVRSNNAENGGVPTFPQSVSVNMNGALAYGGTPNPGGLLGQYDIETDHSDGPNRGNVYLLASVNPPGSDPCDVMFIRSVNGGLSWSSPVKINTDTSGSGRYNWFGTMSVAPCGRIDVVWNDQRNNPGSNFSALFYRSSHDGGLTWGPDVQVSDQFNSLIGHPNQNKIGDYYDMRSTNDAVHVAYAATFNGEQDVFYLRIDVGQDEAPETVSVITGTIFSGGAAELAESDDQRLVVTSDLHHGVQLVVEGTSFTEEPCSLSFTLEASVLNAAGFITQRIELYDFDAESFVTVDSGLATFADSSITVDVTDDPARFVQAGTRKLRARLTWKSGIVTVLRPWILAVDQAAWRISN